MLNAERVFYKLIHAVKIEQSQALINLIAERNALAFGAVNKQLTQPTDILVISEMITDDFFELRMRNVIEKFGYIAFENITVMSVLAVKIEHMCAQTVKSE